MTRGMCSLQHSQIANVVHRLEHWYLCIVCFPEFLVSSEMSSESMFFYSFPTQKQVDNIIERYVLRGGTMPFRCINKCAYISRTYVLLFDSIRNGVSAQYVSSKVENFLKKEGERCYNLWSPNIQTVTVKVRMFLFL